MLMYMPSIPSPPPHPPRHAVQYIISRLHQLDCSRWNITTHSFTDSTPFGEKPFTNIIATLDPEVGKRLVLVAHYDSKYLRPVSGRHFLGATDSALPVALLLDVALSLDSKLQEREVSGGILIQIVCIGSGSLVVNICTLLPAGRLLSPADLHGWGGGVPGMDCNRLPLWGSAAGKGNGAEGRAA